jgi:hypothetical protein
LQGAARDLIAGRRVPRQTRTVIARFPAGDCPSSGGSFSLTYQSTSNNNTVGTSIDYGTMTYASGCTRMVIAIVTNFYASSAIEGRLGARVSIVPDF